MSAVGEPVPNGAEYDVLRSIAHHLIPAAHGMPSAAEVLDAHRLGFVLTARPDLADPLNAALRADLGDDPAERLTRLSAEEPDHLAALQLVIVAAYYTDDSVRGLLGYPGQVAKPVTAHSYPEYVAEDLLDSVLARGPIWRDPENVEAVGP